MVIVKANEQTEAGVLPDETILTAMAKFNQELVNAGVMLAGEGLQASSKGARVRFSGDKRAVIDGPFTETKEQLGGVMVLEAADLNHAIQLMSQLPCMRPGGVLEIRSINEEITR